VLRGEGLISIKRIVDGYKMKILFFLTLMFKLCAFNTITEDRMSANLPMQNVAVQFEGNQNLKNNAIKLLDKVLKEQGDLGVYGNLSGGVSETIKDMNIKIVEEDDYYSIDISPKSSYGGHDFSFTIDKKTQKRSNVVVGEVLPPPDFEE
jgi:hypothetical protein